MKKYENSKILYYLFLYFGIMHFVPFLNIFLSHKPLKTYIFADGVGTLSIFLSFHYIFRRLFIKSKKFSHLDIFVLVYLLLSIFSFVFYFQPNNPASILAYAYGIHYVVFPIFLYFSIKLLDLNSQKFLLKYICYLNLFFIMIGLLLHFFQPDFYTHWLINRYIKYEYIETWQLYGRMHSYFGSIAVGNIAGVTILLISILDFKFALRAFIFSSMVLAALLSHQRGGIIVVVIATLYFLFSKNKRFYKKFFVILVVTFIVFILTTVYEYSAKKTSGVSFIESTKNMVVHDLLFGNPFKEKEDRLGGYIKGWNFFLRYPFGLGVGATLSEADSSGAHPEGQVVDANFMRILADLGLEGAIIFILIIILSFTSALKRKYSLAWILLLLVYCIPMIGSNVLDSFYLSHTFWLLLGIIDTKPYHPKRLELNHAKIFVNNTIADTSSSKHRESQN